MDGHSFRALAGRIDNFLSELAETADRAVFRGVNWKDLRVVDIERRESMLHSDSLHYVVCIEEADSPELRIAIQEWLMLKGYPDFRVETSW